MFELWDVQTGNLIGAFGTEDAALIMVRDLVALNGSEYAAFLDLGWMNAAGDMQLIASGAELLDRVHRAPNTITVPVPR